MELAVYGKGGIGKSTVSASLSAALAVRGRRVLQIGCDPKHDSTRLLMHGEVVPTVLDYLKVTDREYERVEDVMRTGFGGVGCIEAGGPKPGVGCAGRGIISAFEFLDRHQVKQRYDVVVYDVLGDVVCGGFAVPVRREYADAVFLVTSGEFMALYAANNILRGIRNFDGEAYRRVAGIIYNERCLADEDGRVARFAEAVGLPICAKVPRSHAFSLAEERNVTLAELDGWETEKAVFDGLAEQVSGEMPLYPARPLEDEMLEAVVLGTRPPAAARSNADSPEADVYGERQLRDGPRTAEAAAPDKGLPFADEGAALRSPVCGCAFNGAATAAVHLTDAVVIAHSPRACAFYTWQNITSPGRKNLFNRGILMPSAISPNYLCTDMGQAEAVFGGMESLRECVAAAVARRPGAVIVISSCVSGIIGDDVMDVERLSTEETPVIAIAADGDIAGDYVAGIRMCMETLAKRLVDPRIVPRGRLVNLVAEEGVATNRAVNYEAIRSMLDRLGIGVNCRFLGDATVAEMQNLLAAPLSILADTGEEGQNIRRMLEADYGCRFLEGGFPVGFEASRRFVEQLGAHFGCEKEAQEIIAEEERLYLEEIRRLRPALSGVRVLFTTINMDMDWMIGAAHEAGIRFVWVGVLNYLHTPLNVTHHPEYCDEITEEFDFSRLHEKIEELSPDLVLTNYTSTVKSGDYVTDAIPMTPAAGFQSALHLFRRWVRLFNDREEGSWKDDRALFEKYYA